jgi:glycosyltransferase involved in cell wall biosynthesis
MGIDVLVQSIKYLKFNIPDILLVIGGNGIMYEEIKKIIYKNKLKKYIYLIGRIKEKDIPFYYQAADLFILPSQMMEGFGMVTLEALACGTPVIGTPIGATPEILSELGKDFLLKGCDVKSINEGILKIRNKYFKNNKIQKKCRQLVEKNYRWEKVGDNFQKIFKKTFPLSQ